MDRKIQKKYVDNALGFPVVLLNAPMLKVRGEWALHVNYNGYQRAVLLLLAHKPARLTGNEVHFVRAHFELTVRAFAKVFSVKHPAVLKWEAKGNKPTRMSWSTEKDIRLFVLDKLDEKDSELRELYRSLREAAPTSLDPIVINGRDIAA